MRLRERSTACDFALQPVDNDFHRQSMCRSARNDVPLSNAFADLSNLESRSVVRVASDHSTRVAAICASDSRCRTRAFRDQMCGSASKSVRLSNAFLFFVRNLGPDKRRLACRLHFKSSCK